jgi:hypothetical protein
MSVAAFVQDADLVSRLLGIDRARLGDGEWSVTWQHLPPAWVIFLVLIPAVVAGFGFLYRNERSDAGGAVRVLLAGLRAAVFLLVCMLLMGPVLTVETIKTKKAFLIVLLDESRSMQKSDPLRTDADRDAVAKVVGVRSREELRALTRADIVKRVLENPEFRILDELEKKLNLSVFTFSGTASPKESPGKLLAEYRKETCIGTETAIGDAIKAALNSLRGQYVAGVVVFSDGKNNAGIATREIAAQLKQRYLPIYTVAPGVPQASRDIALLEIEARDAVLAHDQLKVNFKVSSLGYDGERIDVGLHALKLGREEKEPGVDPKELDTLVARSGKAGDAAVLLQGGSARQPASIVWEPKEPGDYLLILRADPRAEENTAHNNYLTHRVRVADDKIKVLYVEHPPRYEYRFLKNALVRDPKILAHCFLTSADSDFPQDHTKSEDPLFRQPLQEFPKDLKSLLEFDVVIFGDVDPGRLGPDAARNLEAFVSEFGGGILFISGSMNNPRTLGGTPMANLLPVIPDENRDLYEHDRVYSRMLGYQLTPDGRGSPITQFKEFKGDAEKNLEHWEDRAPPRDGLVGIRWFARVKKLKAGASPLVELTGLEGESARPPLFVTQHVGRGRVFWSATDETWLWRYLQGDYPWFYPFWQQAMYWTREGKLLGARRFRVGVDKERYIRGEPVQVFANAYDERFEPLTEPTLEVTVDPPAGLAGLERIKVQLQKDKARDGYYEGQYRPDDTGLYRIWAGGEDESSRATAKFSVFIPDREDDEPILDVAALKELAQESSNGQFFPIDQVHKLNEAVQKSENQLRETREDDLWDAPLAYLIFALLITVEWVVRKAFRLL